MRDSLGKHKAEVAELVDAHDSKSCSFGSEGSIPSFGTEQNGFKQDWINRGGVTRAGSIPVLGIRNGIQWDKATVRS